MSQARRIALFPASFDPVTNGHLDIARRALRLFDEVILAVAMNVAKSGTFSLEDRLEMLELRGQRGARLRVTTLRGPHRGLRARGRRAWRSSAAFARCRTSSTSSRWR